VRDTPAEERAIIHVDMDAFYASVEVLDDPSLAGRPVVVGGTPEGRGVVAAASYEARRHGVRSATPAVRAVRLCPQAVFLKPRMDRYVDVSERILALFGQYTPLVEPLSIDEAFLDVTACRRLFGSAESIGRDIKRRIAAEIGLPASVGVAPNKFLAKLASDLEKPDGFVVMTAADAPARLAPLPVNRLWGVGRVTEQMLAGLGVHTIADLLAADPESLRALLGEQAGQLRRLAVGRDDRPVVTGREVQSIGNETTFAEDITDEVLLLEILDQLAEKVAWRLRRGGLAGRTVTLKARFSDFSTLTRSVTLPRPTHSTLRIRETARDLLTRRLGRRSRSLRLIGITVSQLVEVGTGQSELFSDQAATREQDLDHVMDRVNARFGKVLRRGGLPRRGRETGQDGER
jgi:DNA polymerase IV